MCKVDDWFHHTVDFLTRVKRFLRDDMEHNSKGKSIFESVVETQSYVVRGFKKMTGLAVFVLLGYLETQKLNFAPGAGAAGGRPLFTLHTC